MCGSEDSVLFRCQFSLNWSVDEIFATIIKISESFLVDINKLNLKHMWKCKEPTIAKIILKKNKVGWLTIPDFKTYSETTVIKTVFYWHKDRQIDQWNKTEPRQFNVFSIWINFTTNVATTTRQPHANEGTSILTSHHIKKITKMDHRSKYKS